MLIKPASAELEKISNSSYAKIIVYVFESFFFVLKTELQLFKFEFCLIKLGLNNR